MKDLRFTVPLFFLTMFQFLLQHTELPWVWIPEHLFGGFVAGVPAPLGIGSATLEDGPSVKTLICKPHAVAGATEIARFGGWRQYLSQALSAR
jgi:allophanate hydrolase